MFFFIIISKVAEQVLSKWHAKTSVLCTFLQQRNQQSQNDKPQSIYPAFTWLQGALQMEKHEGKQM
jgi:hypothetical protein